RRATSRTPSGPTATHSPPRPMWRARSGAAARRAAQNTMYIRTRSVSATRSTACSSPTAATPPVGALICSGQAASGPTLVQDPPAKLQARSARRPVAAPGHAHLLAAERARPASARRVALGPRYACVAHIDVRPGYQPHHLAGRFAAKRAHGV